MHPHGCVCADCSWGDPYGKFDLSTVNPDVASDIIGGLTQVAVAGITAAGSAGSQRQPPPRGFSRAPAPAPLPPPPAPPPPPPPAPAPIPTWAYVGAGALVLVASVSLAVALSKRGI